MIRAIRPIAMAQDDASLITGWNVAPNVEYTLLLFPSSVSCGVFLYADSTLVASGAALAGTEQPCILIPQSGQTIGMVDADSGWHLLLTTTGTESQRTIRIGPAVDLPDEIHPVYGEDDLALVRATAAINAAAHYIDDVTVTCPLGLGAGLGDVVSVPVDGVEVIGQVESITWAGTPSAATEQAVIRRHVAIAPEAFVEIVPPTVAGDTGTATHMVGTSGNVLANDETGLTVVAVNGLAANVGQPVGGDNGGSFTIAADGSWTFSPAGDFAMLEGSETAETSVIYYASDGAAEAMATLTVTVSHANSAPAAVNDAGETDAATTTSGNVLTNDTDGDGDTLTVSKVAGSAGNVGVAVAGSNGGLFTIASNGGWTFDPDGDFSALTGEQTATTSVTYHASDGVAEDEGTLTVTVSAATATDPYWGDVVLLIPMTGANGSTTFTDVKGHTVNRATPLVVETGTGPQEVGSYGRVNITGTYQNTDKLWVTHASDLNIGSQDFCIEFFIRWNQSPSGTYASPWLVTKRSGATGIEFSLYYYAGKIYVMFSANGTTQTNVIIHTWAPTTGTWYYLRVSRGGGKVRLYIDASKVAEANNTTTLHTGSGSVTFFRDSANAFKCDCAMSYLRMTVGSSRETDDTIDIPTLPYPEA